MNETKKRNAGIKFAMEDGKHVWTGVGESGLIRIAVKADELSAEIRHRLMNYGLRVIGDRMTALERDPETGESATIAQKLDRVQRRMDALMAGEWEIRKSAAPKADDPGLLAKAIIRALGLADEAALEKLLSNTERKRGVDRTGALKVWQDTKEVKAAKLEIQRERALAQTSVSAADMMAEMMGDEEADEAPF